MTKREVLSPLKSRGGICPGCGTRAATTSAAPGLENSVLLDFYGDRALLSARGQKDDLELLFTNRQELLDSLIGVGGRGKTATVIRRQPNASLSSAFQYSLRRSAYFESAAGVATLAYPIKPRLESLQTDDLPRAGQGAIVIEFADATSFRRCELIFINQRAPHKYYAGNIREGSSKCELEVTGEAFFTTDRMVIWTKQIYRDADKPVAPGVMLAVEFKEIL